MFTPLFIFPTAIATPQESHHVLFRKKLTDASCQKTTCGFIGAHFQFILEHCLKELFEQLFQLTVTLMAQLQQKSPGNTTLER